MSKKARTPARKTKRISRWVDSVTGKRQIDVDAVDLMTNTLIGYGTLAASDDPRLRIAGRKHMREAAEYVVQAMYEEQQRIGRPKAGEQHEGWFVAFGEYKAKHPLIKSDRRICELRYADNPDNFRTWRKGKLSRVSLATLYGAVLAAQKEV